MTAYRVALLLIASVISGCGYMVQREAEGYFAEVTIGPRVGDLSLTKPRHARNCTVDYLRTNWGAPEAITRADLSSEDWTYVIGTKWVGGGPVIFAIPLPVIYVPTGRKRATFLIEQDRIVSVRYVGTSRDYLALPLAAESGFWTDVYRGVYYYKDDSCVVPLKQ